MKTPLAFALAGSLLAAPVVADELKLKDGTKITGKIVGFEEGAFKVETSYGFALVRRDKVASILIDEDNKPESAKAEPVKPAAAPPEAQRAASAANSSVTAPAPPARPAPPAEPVIRESVEGTAYVNHTFGFRMYKPPSWRVIEGARRLLPSAIVAMGTNDETTLLVLGQSRLTGSLDSHAAATDRQLRQVYENLRVLSDERAVIGGVPAIERRFRGTVGERDWSCVMVTFSRGSDVFTILGMTAADSDLVQIQENVIARTLASLEFERP